MDFMLLKTDAGLKFEGAFIRVRAAKILSFFNIISYLFYKVKSSCGWVSGKYIQNKKAARSSKKFAYSRLGGKYRGAARPRPDFSGKRVMVQKVARLSENFAYRGQIGEFGSLQTQTTRPLYQVSARLSIGKINKPLKNFQRFIV